MIFKGTGTLCKETTCNAHFCRRFSAQNNVSKSEFWKISHCIKIKDSVNGERKKSARGEEKSRGIEKIPRNIKNPGERKKSRGMKRPLYTKYPSTLT